MHKPEELFDRWFVRPLKMLEGMPNGDGAFVVLMALCPLYERYAIAVIKQEEPKAKALKDPKLNQFMKDFETNMDTAKAFWNVIRNGLAHQAMPKRKGQKKGFPRWLFRGSFSRPVELVTVNGEQVLRIQPWLFMEKVLSLWQENLALLTENKSFPWANIFEIEDM